MKRDFPAARVDVFERNRPDDTFGFGVVFSDQTLDTFERVDTPTYEAIRQSFAYWDDIEINFKGVKHRIGGNGFCGCSRMALLNKDNCSGNTKPALPFIYQQPIKTASSTLQQTIIMHMLSMLLMARWCGNRQSCLVMGIIHIGRSSSVIR